MKVIEKKEKRNDLLKRTEYLYVVKHPSSRTPSRAEMQAFVSSDLGIEAERVDIRKIYSRKGLPTTDVRVFVWDEKKVENLNKKEESGGSESDSTGENVESSDNPTDKTEE